MIICTLFAGRHRGIVVRNTYYVYSHMTVSWRLFFRRLSSICSIQEIRGLQKFMLLFRPSLIFFSNSLIQVSTAHTNSHVKTDGRLYKSEKCRPWIFPLGNRYVLYAYIYKFILYRYIRYLYMYIAI